MDERTWRAEQRGAWRRKHWLSPFLELNERARTKREENGLDNSDKALARDILTVRGRRKPTDSEVAQYAKNHVGEFTKYRQETIPISFDKAWRLVEGLLIWAGEFEGLHSEEEWKKRYIKATNVEYGPMSMACRIPDLKDDKTSPNGFVDETPTIGKESDSRDVDEGNSPDGRRARRWLYRVLAGVAVVIFSAAGLGLEWWPTEHLPSSPGTDRTTVLEATTEPPRVPAPTITVGTTYVREPDPGPIQDVVSPVTVKGSTARAGGDEVWLVIKPPKDPTAIPAADREGLYKVANSEPLANGEWLVVPDIGNGSCDEGKVYDLYVVLFRPKDGKPYILWLREQQGGRSYPEMTTLPDRPQSRTLGHVRVRLVDYQGDHSRC